MTTLAVTGYIIGRPMTGPSCGEASFSYLFGTVRFIHFVAAFVFFFNFLGRIYWGFAGNRYARWDQFLPLTPKLLRKQWREAVEVMKVDILQAKVAADGIGRPQRARRLDLLPLVPRFPLPGRSPDSGCTPR